MGRSSVNNHCSFPQPACWVAVISILLLLAGSPVYAQQRAISLAVPEGMAAPFRDVILPRFYEANPDVYVQLTPIGSALFQDLPLPTTADALDGYLEATGQLVSQADVQLVLPFTLGPEATRAGYFLDLNPLIASDANLPVDDFVPALREAFAWDGGQWALPALATPLVVIYDPAVFDAAGLSYPTDAWAFDDFANATRLLASEGSPGMQVNSIDLPAFFRILSGQGFTDGGFPAQPHFDAPELANLLEQWSSLEAEGIVASGFAENVPLRFGRISDLIDRDLRGALLGGRAGADVYGVAVSSGTNDPEAAYRLAAYLTSVPELATLMAAVVPVRYSVVYDDSQWSLPDEARALRQQALENTLTPAEVQFGHYLRQALALVAAGSPPDAALQTAQMGAAENLARADTLRATLQVDVPLAAPPVPAEGVTLRFALFTGRTSLSERDVWQAAIDEFVASDAGVDSIELNFVAPTSATYADEFARNDCVFGYAYTSVSQETLLPLDPLFAADPTYDPADVVGDVMLDVQQAGVTLGIPAAITPYVLRYDPERFAQAGVPLPDGTWTVNEFVEALQQLQAASEGAPLFLDLNYSTPWELLMAGYGVAPVDYSTSPPTLRFSDENVVSVAQEVLDLARAGLIEYQPMATFFGSGASPSYTPALTTEQLRANYSGFALGDDGLVTFPLGTETTPISFYTTSGFIYAETLYPEACYRWLREITRHPELIEGMPAYHTVIADPATQAIYGDSGVATFQRFAELMEAPNRVFIQLYGLGIGESMFMNRAFDRYVLEGADLAAELAQAQILTEAFRACIARENADLIDCLLEADPTIRDNIPPHVLGDR